MARPKRTLGIRVESAVAQLLDRTLVGGLGFVDYAGQDYRQYLYEVEIFASPPSP